MNIFENENNSNQFPTIKLKHESKNFIQKIRELCC